MALQYISDNSDNSGNYTAVIIPITESNIITATHEDLKELIEKKVSQTNNASRFKGLLTNEEAEKYHQFLKQARSEWEGNF